MAIDRRFLYNAGMILIGAAVFAFGIHYFVSANEFMEGGLTGISLLLYYTLGWSPSLTTLLLNIPLFLAGWRWMGLEGMSYSLIGAAGFSLSLWAMEVLLHGGWLESFQSDDLLLAALCAGVVSGLGLGIILRYGGSTGGTTLLAKLLWRLFGWKQSTVILLTDVAVIGAGIVYLSMEKVLYTLIMVYVAAKVIDLVTNEEHRAKSITVYSQAAGLLAERVFGDLARGHAVFESKRLADGRQIEGICCVVSRSDVYRIKRRIKEVDPSAYVIVHDVRDAVGKGIGL